LAWYYCLIEITPPARWRGNHGNSKMNYNLSKGGEADAQALAALALSAALVELLDDKSGRAIVGSALARLPKVGVAADGARRILDGLKI
jgi:hypothetical protein